MSLSDRFEVDLGYLLGVIFGSNFFGSFFRPKLVPELSLSRLIFEKANVHETLRFRFKKLPKLSLRWDQDPPKISPRRVLDRLGPPFFG